MNVVRESYKYSKRFLPIFIACIVIGWLTLSCGLLIPQLIQLILDEVITPAVSGVMNNAGSAFSFIVASYAETDLFGKLGAIITALAIVCFTRFLAHYTRWNIAHATGTAFERRMRVTAFNKMITQNTFVLNRYTQGELMSICNSDPTMVKEMYTHFVPFLTEQIISIGLSIFFLSRISPLLTIAPIVLGLALGIATAVYTRKLRAVFNSVRNANVVLNSGVQESINGVKLIKSFARESFEEQKFAKKNDDVKTAFFSHAVLWSRFQAIFAAMGASVNIVSLITGVSLGATGQLTVGQFTTFVTYVAYITNPMVNISNVLGNLQQTMVCGGRLFSFINTENIIRDIDNPKRLSSTPSFSLKNVDVTIDGKPVLTGINLDIPFGKTLGIMGATGAGKTALLKVITRNYEATRGAVIADGENIKNVLLDDVRRRIAYVSQDVFLFSNTVDANIAFYNPDIAHEKVVEAATLAEAHGFIERLGEGYNTIVGERGLGLSGGQKQRVSIARAILKDAPIIMLDDCTSALDLETEHRIINNLREHYTIMSLDECNDSHQKTLIITSHRAAALAFCDEIIFMHHGEIVERGTHAELMRLHGRYAEIYLKQSAQRLDI